MNQCQRDLRNKKTKAAKTAADEAITAAQEAAAKVAEDSEKAKAALAEARADLAGLFAREISTHQEAGPLDGTETPAKRHKALQQLKQAKDVGQANPSEDTGLLMELIQAAEAQQVLVVNDSQEVPQAAGSKDVPMGGSPGSLGSQPGRS